MTMAQTVGLMFLVIVLFALNVRCSKAQQVVAAYLPDYRSYINVNNTVPHLTDLILFSVVPDKRGTLGGCCLEDHHFEQIRQAKAHKKSMENLFSVELNLWVGVGGAGRMDWLGEVVVDPEKRARLFQQLVLLAKREGLVGIDFDCIVVDKNAKQSEFYAVFELFLKEAADVLHSNGLLLSIALHPGKYLTADLYDKIDRINLMTYDMVGGGKHHAQAEKVDQAVRSLKQSGCPLNKIVLGIPAYGRHIENSGSVKTFAEIIDGMEPSAVGQISSPWKGYAFDGPRAVRGKVKYSFRVGLAGVFFWELGQDKQHESLGAGGILLEAVSAQIYELETAPKLKLSNTNSSEEL